MKEEEVMSNKGLLTLIAILLVGILAVVIVEATQDSPSEEMAESFGQLTETIGNKVNSEISAN